MSIGSVVLAGCGGNAGGAADATGQGGGGRTIVFDFPFTSLPVYSVVLKAAQQRAAERGYKLTTTEDQSTQDLQIANLTTAINSGPAAIVAFPIEPSTLSSLVKSAQEAKIRWVSYASDVKGADGFINISGVESGKADAQAYADWAKANHDEAGTVLVLGNSTIDLGRTRTKGMLDGLKEFAPHATVVQAEALGTDQGISVTRAELARNPKINAVLALEDDTAVGAATALKEAGASPEKTFVGGQNGTPTVLQQIKDGNGFIKATVAVDLQKLGAAVVDVPADLIEKGKSNGFKSPAIIVTKDSKQLDDLIAQFK
jgi:ABC-type sugar transport system substrate-binding protein